MRLRVESTANRRLKASRDLGTRQGVLRQGSFLVEGPRFVSDAMDSMEPDWLILSEAAGATATAAADRAAEAGFDVLEVPEKLFRDLSDTVHSQGILAILPLPHPSVEDISPKGTILLLDGVSDPGNMGTMIRSAAAFGCACVVAGVGSCCPFTPKVTRGSAGMNTRLPVLFDQDLPALMEGLSESTTFLGAEMSGASPGEFRSDGRRTGLVVGSETHGISASVRSLLSGSIGIPMAEGVESLNAAVSGSLLLYLLTRP